MSKLTKRANRFGRMYCTHPYYRKASLLIRLKKHKLKNATFNHFYNKKYK